MTSFEKELQSPLNSRMLSCPTQGNWSSFQLVDEFGSGQAYEGLAYVAVDSEGQAFNGYLDANGIGKVDSYCAGPIALRFEQSYEGQDNFYNYLQARTHYPLKITELQVRAEQTRYRNPDATRNREQPVPDGDAYIQVEVRHLVRHVAHLPPEVYRHYPADSGLAAIMGKHAKVGVALASCKHTVLEVRALRALCPMLSTAPEFCALNLYQLALMVTLSYCTFGQKPATAPIKEPRVAFPDQPSVGNWFADALAKSDELWRVDPAQKNAYYPLYEDVAYSRRLEIVPFDPALYEVNDPALGEDQEHPEKVHFLDDRHLGKEATDTQAFITHNDELILIAVRGTFEIIPDGLRDADAQQVPFVEGVGQVHRGFYTAAQTAYDFTVKYLEKFYAGQKLIICGHSLGGAITLLLAEMLRRRSEAYNIQLYTYGAPRAGDTVFTQAAAPLVHHRMVNHNDPVPSVPGSWMNTKAGVYGTGAALMFTNVPVGLSVFVAGITNWTGEAYDHHGSLHHAMPVEFGRQQTSSILWQPGCDTITQHAACTLALQQKNGLPDRPGLLRQIFNAGHHSMVGGYVPACWAALRRWQQAHEANRTRVTDSEFEWVEQALVRITRQLRAARQDLLARPAAYVRTQERTIEAISHEVSRIETSHARLSAVRHKRVSVTDVYGLLGEQPQLLAESLQRWRTHPENLKQEQLAQAPDNASNDALLTSLYGHTIGAPHTLDIDSII
ncbi:lipase family protein [Pseudomonas fluorescens]|uniref:lipase family protein n=1 Tax=Pseudomonas fluorescens TaxID=294 RepID=UPI000F48C42A|nr:lipase family protein [Pseudomonas fluorescens]RON93742.1 lipase [Pseudomonas fluorescens]